MKANPFFFWKGSKVSKDVARSYSEYLTIRSKLSEVAVVLPEQSSTFLRESNEKEKEADDFFGTYAFSLFLVAHFESYLFGEYSPRHHHVKKSFSVNLTESIVKQLFEKISNSNTF